MTTAVAPTAALTASDRCDRCGAQAYVLVRLGSGGELLFCAHHAKQYESGFRPLAVEVVDETERLTPTPDA